jgi:hypothetical protein
LLSTANHPGGRFVTRGDAARSLFHATESAGQLFVSQGTVKTHVGRILTKLDLRDRVQAVVLAYEAGLVRPGEDPA